MKNTQKGFAIHLIIALVALIAVGGGVYIYNQNTSEAPRFDEIDNEFKSTIDVDDLDDSDSDGDSQDGDLSDNQPAQDNTTGATPVTTTPAEPVFCTMDAFQCPDGSWVGRTGPDCVFVCPSVTSVLTQELVEKLVAEKWSDCSSGDCADVEISFTADRGNQYLISATFTEYDDSVSKTKREGLVLFSNGSLVWTDYQPSPNEWRICHPGRGSQVFSTDKCF